MSSEDRRAPGAARIAFDGLVEVGGALGPTFEAQAVNVSEEGMQLRTAYLPELGQQVTCRFEATPSESVIGSGEVVWAQGADKGGEFGIRFTEIDADSVEALKRVCGLGATAAAAQPGAKVRLYIDGLASPMRAKIRDARPTAITVGSELGFLQVGKQLELEDTQSGHKRPASIDRVDVAVDPNSHIPQLIVTLRYEDLPVQVDNAPRDAGPSDDLAALDDASARMKGAFARQVARVGPALERLTRRARLTVALLAKRQGEDDAMPRRTTAPPLGGGLHATGRRVVRGEAGGQAGDEAPPLRQPRAIRRKAVVGATVMLVAIAGAVTLKRLHHEQGPATSAAAPAEIATATTAVATAAPASVPGPVQPSAAQASPPLALAPPAGPPSSDEEADSSHRALLKKHAKVTPFGNGPVHHGNVLRLRMDGPIESIEGAQLPTGFAVKLPGRRSVEAAGPLAARDSRIGAIKVTNETGGAELTVAFKDGVPNYQVSAKGEALVITLAPPGPIETTVAKRDDKGAKSKHSTRGRDANPER